MVISSKPGTLSFWSESSCPRISLFSNIIFADFNMQLFPLDLVMIFQFRKFMTHFLLYFHTDHVPNPISNTQARTFSLGHQEPVAPSGFQQEIDGYRDKVRKLDIVLTLDSPVCFSLSACFMTLCKKSICLMVRSSSASMLHC